METQRQGSDQAIAPTTPVRLGLGSLVPLLANPRLVGQQLAGATAAGYAQALPTLADPLALLRRQLWAHFTFQISADATDRIKVPRVLLERFNDLLSYAA